MKYKYLYQSKDNVIHEGWIDATNRADAYTRLRKQHIRPFRVIGEDPIQWKPWAIGCAFLFLLASVLFLVFRAPHEGALPRMQLEGDSDVISTGMSTNWTDLFATKLDCYLSAYAQPGWIALPPEMTEEEIAHFSEDLKMPLNLKMAPNPESKQLMRIVLTMRAELESYLASGGSVQEYLSFLEDRQDQERDFRAKMLDALARAPASMRKTARMNMNVRLKEMGLLLLTTTENE